MSSTSTRSADDVLDELKRVLELADIMYKLKGSVDNNERFQSGPGKSCLEVGH